MRGAVAGGHPQTAEAGARVLEAGGNAVDAAVAAALVSWVAESPLTGPGAGGVDRVSPRLENACARLRGLRMAACDCPSHGARVDARRAKS